MRIQIFKIQILLELSLTTTISILHKRLSISLFIYLNTEFKLKKSLLTSRFFLALDATSTSYIHRSYYVDGKAVVILVGS